MTALDDQRDDDVDALSLFSYATICKSDETEGNDGLGWIKQGVQQLTLM